MSQKRPVSIILGPADPESCREPWKGKRRGFSEAFAGFWKGPGWEAPGRPLGGAWEALGGPGAAGGLQNPAAARGARGPGGPPWEP